jgi:hypothetical protein
VTIQPSSLAERVDLAVERLVHGTSPALAAASARLDPADRRLLEAAIRVQSALTIPPIGSRFEARLGTRLAEAAHAAHGRPWALRHPGRLIVTGAVGSAVGVGMTAYAVWRSSRRQPRPAHRFLVR